MLSGILHNTREPPRRRITYELDVFYVDYSSDGRMYPVRAAKISALLKEATYVPVYTWSDYIIGGANLGKCGV